jgi:hypothetical protein
VLNKGNPIVSPGSPVLSLQEILALISTGANETIELILKIAKCRSCHA